jgi:hypothetical protein
MIHVVSLAIPIFLITSGLWACRSSSNTQHGSEELLADAEHLGSTEKRPSKVAPPTSRGYDIVLKDWMEHISIYPLYVLNFY